MSAFKRSMQGLRVGATVLLTLIMLSACIGQDERKQQGFTPLDLAEVPPTDVATAEPTPEGKGGTTGLIPPTSQRTLDAASLVTLQPNELGVVPVLMYHAFVTNPTDDEWTRTLDDFHSDLQWLYDNDFHIITMRSLIDNEISAPPGKHPVVLTFDDASARQFQFEKNSAGELVPSMNSAVGVLEAFFARHPDFGHTSFFALLPYNCFSFEDEEYNTIDFCEEKLTWLAENGYEIGNHTWGHQNLSIAGADKVTNQIGRTMDFIDERVSGPANMSKVLVLPYGAIPDPTVDWFAWSAVYEGFMWGGELIELDAVVNVTGGPMVSPASTEWDALSISRFNTEPALIDYWFDQFATGSVIPYTSDGNPETVVVPNDETTLMATELDPASLAASGKTVLTYDRASGSVIAAHETPIGSVSTHAGKTSVIHRKRVVGTELALA